ncbi:MAG: 50S ribosomal protein L15 [Candidatus Electrothrix sp. AW2]|jgi:large subunit ribosomal protein L15|nr:50S ribosomal protein L15 [Candidatus Electrothrix sp. AX1]MCI5117788.1 50S ribosomal protein L15 [Candidatus Electrothrix gigas]MCI5133775.1 50S ribosomal protein L15 [Candidatus Electrothrix gigas]MCI5177724.1 50S ribosomal protein L15 [Candidatus Electrothrix gigas]MCI5182272.1 50S ribosomal protein L15 [Candidatus Electrothrix gigas]
MLSLNNLSPNKGVRKAKKRVGRGPGSGLGKTAGRGHKGARSRSGYTAKPGFEGGQMPLHRRLPKRGFTNTFKTTYKIISLSDLDTFDDGATVDRQALLDAGLITERDTMIKVLANGEISKKVQVEVDKVSQGAQEKIIAAGGTVKE